MLKKMKLKNFKPKPPIKVLEFGELNNLKKNIMANQNNSALEKAREKFTNHLNNMCKDSFCMYMKVSKNIICL